MRRPSLIKTAYLAGYFDGEGSIGVYRNSLRISVSSGDSAVVDLFQRTFGGTLSVYKKPNSKRWLSTWKLTGKPAQKVLLVLLPFLTTEKKKAIPELLRLDFQVNSTKRLSLSEVDKRKHAEQTLKKINQRRNVPD